MMLVAMLAGCGDDATTKEGDGKGDDVADSEREDSKDAGTTGDEARPDAGDGKVRCGGEICPDGQITKACCTLEGAGKAGDPLEFTGRAADLCGADLSEFVEGDDYACIQTNQPGKLDPACPVVPSPGGDLMGCCSSEGFCGGMDTFIPLGCTYGASGRAQACAK